MSELLADRLRFTGDQLSLTNRAHACVRVGVLVLGAVGAYLLGDSDRFPFQWLLFFYAFGFICSLGFIHAQAHRAAVSKPMKWVQVLANFGVIAATVNFTGGATSFFAFLFVIAILEAGLLLGQREGFIMAALATGAMIAQSMPNAMPSDGHLLLSVIYNLVVQGLAFFLTAFVSGYWTQRVNRMQQFQREILDNMNNGFLITDCHGRVTAQNKAADRILNVAEGTTLGLPVQDVLCVESGSECPILTALRAETDFTSYEFTTQTAGDASLLLGLTTSRIYDARGNFTGIISSFSDLTEMAKLREDVKRQDLMVAVGELAAELAHEIRNPVAAIRGAVDEIQDSLDFKPLAEKLAAIAVRESDHLNHIVSGFLDFARKPTMRRESFDARGLIEEVRDSLRRKFTDSLDLTIAAGFPDNNCMISGDRMQLKQVFMNIGKNAIEAMDERGTLGIVAAPNSGSVEVRFDDEGPGIEPDKVARIFEPFFTTKDSGVGMGLAVCMRIVTAHDGTIRTTSREGGGTSMSVRLPVAQVEEY